VLEDVGVVFGDEGDEGDTCLVVWTRSVRYERDNSSVAHLR